MNLLLKLLEMLLHSMDIGRNIVHHDIELSIFNILFLLVSLGRLFLFDKICMSHSDHILMVHLLVDLQLSTFIGLILLKLLDSHNFARTFQCAHENFCKSTDTALDLPGELVFLLK